MFTVQPFGNSMVTMTLTGDQIERVIEEQFAGCTLATARILQVSAGFTYTWSASGPGCDKVDSATIKLNGVAIDPAASKRVTVNSFLADGGDSFPTLKRSKVCSIKTRWSALKSRPPFGLLVCYSTAYLTNNLRILFVG
jgi:2',3'-cyclic-nucleotide 2'-phosphodiesterase (5'-nucleotidase family)